MKMHGNFMQSESVIAEIACTPYVESQLRTEIGTARDHHGK